MPIPTPTLELTIRQYPIGTYTVEARLSDLSRQADIELVNGIPISLDEQLLREVSPTPDTYGQRLTDMLFAASAMREAWNKVYTHINSTGANLRVRIRLDPTAEDLHHLRWETLCDPESHTPIATNQRLLLSRYLDSRSLSSPNIPDRPGDLRALVVVSNPTDLASYNLSPIDDVPSQIASITQALGPISPTIIGDPASSEMRRATLSNIVKVLGTSPHIFYLVCHGTYRPDDQDTYLWLENEDGTNCRISGTALSRRLTEQTQHPPLLVILAACNSAGNRDDFGATVAIGPHLAREGIIAVLAMQDKISQSTIKQFIPTFFTELCADGQVDRALATARVTIQNKIDWWQLILFLRARDGRIWGDKETTVQRQSRSEPTLAAALNLFAALPLDNIPTHASFLSSSHMQLERNSLFVGRETDLQRLAESLKAPTTEPFAVVITGIGGVGKTSLATEFAYRYGQYFAGGVFWLNFTEPTALPAEIAICGGPGHMRLFSDKDEMSLDAKVKEVQEAWRKDIPRLLIFDNCEDEHLLTEYLPKIGGCRVLVSSRRIEWRSNRVRSVVSLDVFSPSESIALFRKYFSFPVSDDVAFSELARELGDLPLAMDLAGMFLKFNLEEITVNDYLNELRSAPLLSHESFEAQVERTFAVSYQRLKRTDKVDALAIEVLARIACLQPGGLVPRDLLDAMFDLSIRDALSRLENLGLLKNEKARRMLRMHRLVAVFAQTLQDIEEARVSVETMMLEKAKQANDAHAPNVLLPIQSHLKVIVDTALQRADARAAALCYEMDRFLSLIGHFKEAGDYSEKALKIGAQILGIDHTDTIEYRRSWGVALQDQGELTKAQEVFEQVLNILDHMAEADPITLAETRHNLATLLDELGNKPAALQLYTLALTTFEQHGQTDSVACVHNDLAALYYDEKQYPEAEESYRRALTLMEQVRGSDHRDIALILDNVGELYTTQEKFELALPLYERALTIWERVVGPNSPDTALTLQHLADCRTKRQEHTIALPLYERSLTILEQSSGSDNLQILDLLDAMVSCLIHLDDSQQAEKYRQRALQIRNEETSPR